MSDLQLPYSSILAQVFTENSERGSKEGAVTPPMFSHPGASKAVV